MNPEEFTTEQKEQLKTWAGQRDSLSSEISILRTEQEKLSTLNKELAYSNLDIETRIVGTRERIEELKIKEKELSSVISTELASLQSQKSTLESEINNLSKIVEMLISQKTSLEADVLFAMEVLNSYKESVKDLAPIVDRVTTVSNDNAKKIDSLVNDLATSLEEIISVNRKNVFETNVVIEKLPIMLMEAQKHGLIKNKT